MASYIVLEPTDAVKLKAGKQAAGDNTVFVRDEFAFFALILPFFWLLVHRLWWHALMILLIFGGVFNVLAAYFSAPVLVPVLTLLASLFVALEGRNWYLASLRRKGYEEVALISADDLSDAETLYFYDAVKPAERAEPAALPDETQFLTGTATGNPAPAGDNAMIGLVEYRGRA